jgi:tartrate dehydrogenase/decarboxylase / D-malate dehydrogenase
MSDEIHDIAVIPGDGIGGEVVPAAQRVLERVAANHGFGFRWQHYDWGCERYLETGAMMPEDGLEQLRAHEAVFLGAVGAPGVPDHVSLWGLLIPIRRAFEQYVNLRPIRLFDAVHSPLANPPSIDLVVVRENVEGEYSEVGGRLYAGQPGELAAQLAVFTRRGTERVVRYAFARATERRGHLVSATKSNGIIHTMPFWDEVVDAVAADFPSVEVERVVRYAFARATERRGHLVSATKSNGIIHTMPFWDEVVDAVAADFPSVEVERVLIDALCARVVRAPESLDVVVGSNLFGDILSDLTAAVAGSIGIAPAANLNPEREHPSMFEPVHGSAPDIAGQGIANPVGQVWTGALMLEHLGRAEAAAALHRAIEEVLDDRRNHTPDLGGRATTEQVTAALEAAL